MYKIIMCMDCRIAPFTKQFQWPWNRIWETCATVNYAKRFERCLKFFMHKLRMDDYCVDD